MNIERFKALLEAYGANPGRWPEVERVAALLFVEQSAEARNLLAEAAAFDRVLDAAETQPATRALEERILAAFPEREAALRTGVAPVIFGGLRWLQAGALAFSLLLGLAVGAALPAVALGDQDGADPALIALTAGGQDLWDDMGDGI